jgi:hypothetical protein
MASSFLLNPYFIEPSRILKKVLLAGCSKMLRDKAPEKN